MSDLSHLRTAALAAAAPLAAGRPGSHESFGWSLTRSRTGGPKAVGTGEQQGQALYGQDAIAATRGQKVKRAAQAAGRGAVAAAKATGRGAVRGAKATAKGATATARAARSFDRAAGKVGAWGADRVLGLIDTVQDWGNAAADADSLLAKLTVKYPAAAARAAGDLELPIIGRPLGFIRAWHGHVRNAARVARQHGAVAGLSRVGSSAYGYFGADYFKTARRFGVWPARALEVTKFLVHRIGTKALAGAAVGAWAGGLPGAAAGALAGAGLGVARLAIPLETTTGASLAVKPAVAAGLNAVAGRVLTDRQSVRGPAANQNRLKALRRLNAARANNPKFLAAAELPPAAPLEHLTVTEAVRQVRQSLGYPVPTRWVVAALLTVLTDDPAGAGVETFAWKQGARGGRYWLPDGKPDVPVNRKYGKAGEKAANAGKGKGKGGKEPAGRPTPKAPETAATPAPAAPDITPDQLAAARSTMPARVKQFERGIISGPDLARLARDGDPATPPPAAKPAPTPAAKPMTTTLPPLANPQRAAALAAELRTRHGELARRHAGAVERLKQLELPGEGLDKANRLAAARAEVAQIEKQSAALAARHNSILARLPKPAAAPAPQPPTPGRPSRILTRLGAAGRRAIEAVVPPAVGTLAGVGVGVPGAAATAAQVTAYPMAPMLNAMGVYPSSPLWGPAMVGPRVYAATRDAARAALMSKVRQRKQAGEKLAERPPPVAAGQPPRV